MELVTLGGLRLEGSAFAKPKLLLLLVYVSLEGPQERGRLARLFWDHTADPRANLRVALARLREAVPDAIEADARQVATTLTTDAGRLMKALDLHQVEKLALYRGPFLRGYDARGLGPELEEWVYGTRERVAGRVRTAMLELAERRARSDDWLDAAAATERAYTLPGAPEPTGDELRRIYRLLLASGSTHTADVLREASAFGVSLDITRDEARTFLASEQRRATPPENPYKGLAAFREEDAEVFFGRSADTDELVQHVHRQRLALLVGSSGSGKSSLVFAGLVPALRAQGGWRISEMRPGRTPFHALASALLPHLHEPERVAERLVESHALADRMSDGALSLSAVVDEIQRRAPGTRLLLAIDQFEELFGGSYDHPAKRDAFLDLLIGAHRAVPNRLRILLVLRADFVGHVLSHRTLVEELKHGEFLLGPLSEAGLREAIEKPAKDRGLHFEPGLVDRLVRDVHGRPGNLPLLQFALDQLWQLANAGTLTHEAYDAIGGVERALAQHAERTLDGMDVADRAIAQKVFLQLVHPGDDNDDTRRIARREELGEAAWSVVARLATARLVVTGRDGQGADTVELIHEALIHGWTRFHTWLDEHRAFRTWQERVRAETKVWLARDRGSEALLRGYFLAEAQQKLVNYQHHVSRDETAFIEASVRHHHEELSRRRDEQRRRLELETRRARQFRRLAIAVTGLLVVALAAAGIAVDRQRHAQRQRALAQAAADLARARELVAKGQVAFEERPALGLRLVLGGLTLLDDSEARDATGLLETAHGLWASGRLAKLGSDVERIVVKDGLPSMIVDHEAGPGAVIDVADGRTMATLAGEVKAAWPSPDGRTIVLDYHEAPDEVWTAAGRVRRLRNGGDGDIDAVTFVDGGSWFVVDHVGARGELRRARSGDPSFDLADEVEVTFVSPAGSMVVVDYVDAPGDVRTAEDPGSPSPLSGDVERVWFAPDGSAFIVSYVGAASEVRRAADLDAPVTLSGTVTSAWFGPDGSVALDYEDAAGEIRSLRDPDATVSLTDRVQTAWSSPDGSLWIVDYLGAVSEIRFMAQPARPIVLPSRVQRATFAAGGSVLVLRYLGAASEVRLASDLTFPLDLGEAVEDVWTDPAGELLIVDHRDAPGQVRSLDPTGEVLTLLEEIRDVTSFAGGRILEVRYPSGRSDLLRASEPVRPVALPGDAIDVWESDGDWLVVTYLATDGGELVSELRTPRRPDARIELTGVVADVTVDRDQRWLVVAYSEAAGEIRAASDPGRRVGRLASIVEHAEFSPGGAFLSVRYADGRAELRPTTRPPSQVTPLGLGLSEVLFVDDDARIVTRYTDGRAYLLDGSRLRDARDPRSVDDLLAQACRGPLTHPSGPETHGAPSVRDPMPSLCGPY